LTRTLISVKFEENEMGPREEDDDNEEEGKGEEEEEARIPVPVVDDAEQPETTDKGVGRVGTIDTGAVRGKRDDDGFNVAT